MVHCPNCGTPNKEGSKFCNDCGTLLAPAVATRRCPVCQTANPAGNVRCDNCGTRLAPAAREEQPAAGPAPVKGLHLPTKEPAATPAASDEEPDWLRQLRGSGPGAPTPGPEPAAEPAADVPDWLKALGGAGAPAAAPSPADEVPDWLKGLGTSAPAEPEPPVPDWLTGSTAAAQPAAPDVPEWLRAAATEPAAQPHAPSPEPPGSPAGKDAEGTAPPEMELPDWLTASGAPLPWETPAAEQPAASQELPEWLRSAEPAPAVRPAPPPASETTQAEGSRESEAVPAELPDWLRGLRPAEATEPQPQAGAPPGAGEEVPDWLAGIGAAPETQAGGLAAAELPDWLRDLAPTTPPAAPPPAQPQPPAAAPQPPQPERPAAQQPLPVRAGPPVTPPSAPAPSAIPEEADAGLSGSAEVSAEDMLAVPADLGEMPDWLQGMAADFDKPLAPTELPDWLGGASAGEAATAPPPAAPARPEQPAPRPEPAAPRFVPPLAPTDAEVEDLRGAAAQLAPADIPEWLRALRPDTGEGAPPSGGEWAAAAATGMPAAAGLAEASIPDWLQALKPRELREPGAAEAEPAELAETAGVLAGIRGVIAAEPIIAIPRQAPPATEVVVTADHAQLADLLQRLATEEVVAPPRTVSRAAEVRSAAMRGFVYVLVLAAALLPLLGNVIPGVREIVAPFFPDPLPVGSLPDNAVLATYGAVEAVGPGDAVLVGFDTSAAGYGEMRPLAEALVAHLMQRGARIVVVSTQAPGPALAEHLILTEREYPQGAYSNLGFLPGGPLGLASLADTTTGVIGADFRGDTAWTAQPALHGLVAGDAPRQALDLSRFKLIVVIANDPQVLRGWIEQVRPRQKQVPMVAAVSAASESLALSYWRPGAADSQLAGVVSGVAGADRYERALGAASTGRATDTRPARGLAQLAVAAIIVVGLFVHGIGLLLRRGS